VTDPTYSPALLDHFQHPRHAGSLPGDTPGLCTGEAEEPDGGRLVRFWLSVAPDDRIAEIRFKAFGCPATIAAASLASERLSGRPRREAAALEASALALALALPEARAPAVALVVQALRRALAAAERAP
jgi:nitrogen fixation NifU-like protein